MYLQAPSHLGVAVVFKAERDLELVTLQLQVPCSCRPESSSASGSVTLNSH